MKRLVSLTLCSLALTAGSLLAEETAPATTVAPAAPAASTESADSAKNAKRRAELLKRFDANGDGKLDESERAAMREAGEEFKANHPRAAKKVREKALEKFDTNKDGKLDETEKAAAKKWREENAAKRGKKGEAAAAAPETTENP